MCRSCHIHFSFLDYLYLLTTLCTLCFFILINNKITRVSYDILVAQLFYLGFICWQNERSKTAIDFGLLVFFGTERKGQQKILSSNLQWSQQTILILFYLIINSQYLVWFCTQSFKNSYSQKKGYRRRDQKTT